MKIIVAGNMPADLAGNLKNHGFEICHTKPLKALLDGLWYHPDMQLARLDNTIFCEPSMAEFYIDFVAQNNKNFVVGNTALQSNYPQDIAYNIKVVDDYVFHNFKYTDKKLSEAIDPKIRIDVAQGYSGCSICSLADGAVITSDHAIHRTCNEHNIDCLLICAGYIVLDGFDYGFIGGASFLYGDVLYVFGSLKWHPDRNAICEFCLEHKTKICELSESTATDYGSAVIVD